MNTSNDNGLGLFDEMASAAGSFPSALRGYDRSSVDDYVRSLEAAVVASRRRSAALESEVGALSDRLREAGPRTVEDPDFADLGARASEILRLAEEQAREVLDHATVDAEKIKEVARRDADTARIEALRSSGDLRSSGTIEIERLRARGQEDIQQQLEKAKAEAGAVLAAARRQAESGQRAADHEAQTLRQTAYLDTENLRRAVEREVAEIRAGIAGERELALGELRTLHQDAVGKTSALLAEATQHHKEAAERLEVDISDAARIRGEALAEAERVRLAAVVDAEEIVAAAKNQATKITERTQQEFGWRQEQLRRETELLAQRKQAVLNQLASLSALAEQTAHSFPEIGPPDDDPADESHESLPSQVETAESGQADAEERADTDEQSVETVLMPTLKSGAHPRGQTDGPTGSTDRGHDLDADGDDEDELEVDGDATIVVPLSALPAGTAHLSAPANRTGHHTAGEVGSS